MVMRRRVMVPDLDTGSVRLASVRLVGAEGLEPIAGGLDEGPRPARGAPFLRC